MFRLLAKDEIKVHLSERHEVSHRNKLQGSPSMKYAFVSEVSRIRACGVETRQRLLYLHCQGCRVELMRFHLS